MAKRKSETKPKIRGRGLHRKSPPTSKQAQRPHELPTTQRLLDQIKRLEIELDLRTRDTTFLVDIPIQHRVHGQGTAFQCGVEAAYRGRLKRNPYDVFTVQHRAWDTGFSMATIKFAQDFAAEYSEWKP